MNAPRIPALRPLLPATSPAPFLSRPAPVQRSPSLGETLILHAEEGTLFAIGQEGKPVTLVPGMVDAEHLATDLQPGDVLMVKVLATTPRLELARLGASASSAPTSFQPPGNAGIPASMQPDQAAILRMAWAAPDAATLASHWQIDVHEHIKNAAWDRGLFPVHAWHGLPMVLQLLPPVSRRETGARKRVQGWSLRISGHVPGLGQVDVQVQLMSDGSATLLVATDDAATLKRLRQAQAAVAQAVNRAGLRLLDCHWLLRAPSPGVMPDPGADLVHVLPTGAPRPPGPTLPSPLFQVAANVLVALGSLSPASR